MAHQTIRTDISSVIFALTKELWGRSVIMPGQDENYERGMPFGDSDLGKEKGVSMACYMHNVMPTAEGYQSIGYMTNITGDGVSTDFDRVFPLLQSSPQNAHFLFSPSSGKNRIFDATVGPDWVSVSPLAPGVVSDSTIVTTAYIQGETYIYYSGIGCYKYNQVTKALDAVVLGGLTASAIMGLTASFGYMIAFSATAVAWSNATVPTDFVPDLATGAGGGSVNDIKGNIICCVPVSGGFLVFCEKNVVAAKYTGNIRFPFIFKEIPGSGGVATFDQIAVGSNLGDIYAYTTSGMQSFSLQAVDNIYPEVSDFLAKQIFEDFDETTLAFTEQNISTPLYVKVAAVSDRFVVISYGVAPPVLTHALIYDRILKRWGKLKITHRACFQWNAPNLFGAITYGQLGTIGLTYGDLSTITYGALLTSVNTPEVPLKTLCFLQEDGTVKLVDFDLSLDTAAGVFLLGKFQVVRTKFIAHQYTDIENPACTKLLTLFPSGAKVRVPSEDAFKLYVIPTIDGKTFLTPIRAKTITPLTLTSNVRRMAAWVKGLNYSLLMIGAFNLVSVTTDFTVAGDN